jgi:hypothetical protein
MPIDYILESIYWVSEAYHGNRQGVVLEGPGYIPTDPEMSEQTPEYEISERNSDRESKGVYVATRRPSE